jgi:AraC-like DNA-binding protein
MEEMADKIQLLSSINLNNVDKVYKTSKYLDFMKMKNANSKLTQKEICQQLNISDSSMKRIRKELGVPSPYRSNTTKNNKNNKESLLIESNPILYENNLKLIENRNKIAETRKKISENRMIENSKRKLIESEKRLEEIEKRLDTITSVSTDAIDSKNSLSSNIDVSKTINKGRPKRLNPPAGDNTEIDQEKIRLQAEKLLSS